MSFGAYITSQIMRLGDCLLGADVAICTDCSVAIELGKTCGISSNFIVIESRDVLPIKYSKESSDTEDSRSWLSGSGTPSQLQRSEPLDPFGCTVSL